MIADTDVRVFHVVSDEDVEILRQIRNGTVEAGTYSHNNEIISPEQQARWWAANWGTANAWYIEVDGEPAGFALLTLLPPEILEDGLPRRIEASATTTAGVLPKFSGRGLATRLMQLLEASTGLPLAACARLDNPVGMHLHRPEAGWYEVRRDEVNAYYRREATT